jgi:dihydroxy-acid dehydratase
MDDLYQAGGLAPVFRELKPLLNLDCLTVSGRTLGDELDDLPAVFRQEVVRTIDQPIHQGGSIAVLNGNLAGSGAIIKQSAGTPELMAHTGKAVVFESIEDMAARIDDTDLKVSETDVLVMKNCGPRGAPGMPEAGYIPIPKKLARNGVKDMVRISDGRMSGTAFGTIVLHASPESAIGGPLALVENGDLITLDVPNRLLTLNVEEAELERRRACLKPPVDSTTLRGYLRLYHEQVNQAEKGCDFDFMTAHETVAKTP